MLVLAPPNPRLPWLRARGKGCAPSSHPEFVRDTRPGQTNGQDLHNFGAGWHVLSPAGKRVAK